MNSLVQFLTTVLCFIASINDRKAPSRMNFTAKNISFLLSLTAVSSASVNPSKHQKLQKEECIEEEEIVFDDFMQINKSWTNMNIDTFASYGEFLGRYGKDTSPPSRIVSI